MNRTTALVLIGIVVLSTGVPAVAAQSSDNVTLEVTVVDDDGDSVGGATLVATWDGGETTEDTKSNGKALVDVPEGADVELDIDSDEYVRNEPYEIEDATGSTIEMSVARQGTATVSVTTADGTAIGNAVVRLRQGGDLVVKTRAGGDGQAQTGTIERGEYEVVAYKAGYKRNSTDVDVTGDVSTSLSLNSGSVTVGFTVVDDHFNESEPVENATITVGNLGTVSTLSNGESTVSVPVNSKHELVVTKDGYETVEETLSVDEESTSQDVSISRTDAINIDPENDRIVVNETLRVRIIDEYGQPVEGATVTLNGEDVGETDADGETTMTIESAGDQTIGASAGDLDADATVEGIDPDAPADGTATDGSETEVPETETESTTDAIGPGFTVGAALAALLLVALAGTRD